VQIQLILREKNGEGDQKRSPVRRLQVSTAEKILSDLIYRGHAKRGNSPFERQRSFAQLGSRLELMTSAAAAWGRFAFGLGLQLYILLWESGRSDQSCSRRSDSQASSPGRYRVPSDEFTAASNGGYFRDTSVGCRQCNDVITAPCAASSTRGCRARGRVGGRRERQREKAQRPLLKCENVLSDSVHSNQYVLSVYFKPRK